MPAPIGVDVKLRAGNRTRALTSQVAPTGYIAIDTQFGLVFNASVYHGVSDGGYW